MAKTATAKNEKAKENQQQNDTAQDDSKTQVQSAEFPEAAGAEAAGTGGSIEILLDMNIPITVALGKKELPVRRLLQLGPNSVLKLDKTIDAPADLYLKDTRFATGSVVVVDGRFAVKIKDIIGLGNSTANSTEG